MNSLNTLFGEVNTYMDEMLILNNDGLDDVIDLMEAEDADRKSKEVHLFTDAKDSAIPEVDEDNVFGEDDKILKKAGV